MVSLLKELQDEALSKRWRRLNPVFAIFFIAVLSL